jgi:hypothetical protein
MIEQGNIFFIPKYEYEDGGKPTDKLLIVLYVDEIHSLIIKALPTSQEKIPDKRQFHGCTNNEILSFYMFEENRIIGTTTTNQPFCFNKNTFVLVKDNVGIESINNITNYYKDRIKHLGMLSPDELSRLLKCIQNSSHLKRKVRRLMDQLLN